MLEFTRTMKVIGSHPSFTQRNWGAEINSFLRSLDEEESKKAEKKGVKGQAFPDEESSEIFPLFYPFYQWA